MAGRGRTIKVSKEEWEQLKQTRALLQEKGLQSTGLTDEEEEDLGFDWETFALGAIAGLGAYLLYKSLKGEK